MKLRSSTLILLGISLIVILSGIVVFQYFNLKATRDNLEFSTAAYARQQFEADKRTESLKKEMIQIEDSLGKKVLVEKSRVEVVEASKSNLEWMLKAQDKFLTQRLNEFGVKLKDLQSITNLKVETSGQFITITKDSVSETTVKRPDKPDTVARTLFKTFDYQSPDGWFSMKGNIKGDSISVIPSYKNEFDFAIYDRKKDKRFFFDWFRRKETVGEVIDRNPYTRTKKLQIIVKKQK